MARGATTSKDDYSFDREINIREKRIEIIFKIIYVVALAFATLFASLSDIRMDGISEVYLLEAACTSFLLCLLIYMLVYIFNELKCLKLTQTAVSENQYTRTDDSYSFIFIYFALGSASSFILTTGVGIFKEDLDKDIMTLTVSICAILASIIGNVMHTRYTRLYTSVSSILLTAVVFGLLLLTAMV